MSEQRRCHYCGKTEQEFRDAGDLDPLRPYGPGGSDVCFTCAKATPERAQATEQAFEALLDATQAISPGPVRIGTDEGPVPFDPRAIPTDQQGSST